MPALPGVEMRVVVAAGAQHVLELAELAAYLEADLRCGDLPSARSQALLLPAGDVALLGSGCSGFHVEQ